MLNEETIGVDMDKIEDDITKNKDGIEKKKKKKVQFSDKNETIYYEKDESENNYFNLSLNNFNYFECFYNEMYDCDFDEKGFKTEDIYINGEKGNKYNKFYEKDISDKERYTQTKKNTFENGLNINENMKTDNLKIFNLKREKFSQSFNEDCSFEVNDIHTAIINAEEKTSNYSKYYFGYDIEPFNMKNELKEGYIDKYGNYIYNESDNDDIEEAWLKSVDEKDPFSTFSDQKLKTKIHNEINSKYDEANNLNNDLLTVNIYDALYSLCCLLIDKETPIKAMIRYKNDLKLCKNYLNECKLKIEKLNSLSNFHENKNSLFNINLNNEENNLDNSYFNYKDQNKKKLLQINIKKKDISVNTKTRNENFILSNEENANMKNKDEIENENEIKKDIKNEKEIEHIKNENEIKDNKKNENEVNEDIKNKEETKEDMKNDNEIKNKEETKEDMKNDNEIKNKEETKEDMKNDNEIKNKEEAKEDMENDNEIKNKEKTKEDMENDNEIKNKEKTKEDIKNDNEIKNKEVKEDMENDNEIKNKEEIKEDMKSEGQIKSKEVKKELKNEEIKIEEVKINTAIDISHEKIDGLQVNICKGDIYENSKHNINEEKIDKNLINNKKENNNDLVNDEKLKELHKLEETYLKIALDYKTIERRFNNLIDLTQKLTNEYKNVYFLTKNEFENLCKKLEEYKENVDIQWQFKWNNDLDNNIYGPFNYYDIYNLISVGIVSAANPIQLRRINNENQVLENIWQMYDAVNYLTFVSNDNIKKKRKLNETDIKEEHDVEHDNEESTNSLDEEYDIKKKRKKKKGLIQISKKNKKSNEQEDSDNDDDFESCYEF
ncbi:conserved Plasmodium protein, unknown function [Plasmodium relictum]|uniref:GYF domain-containing protein n=1 Tax=Plasmodium relictum TaxID=85471 RepID=A0A1J1H6F5_PLARL|nr:conserved Plasmodium protein, unknown function [Plasmodium relictum]CRG99178.1 conserved Plasmodium protein, unknown function [Plasmodium relictum]